MAYDKVVDSSVLDAGLGDIADAIRAKGGTSADLTFPSGFVSAIQGIKPILKMGVLRPDAELMKTISYDKLIHADEEVTMPGYTTTQTVLKATAALSETYTISYGSYDWYILIRTLTIPTYNVSTKGKGRAEYHFSSTMYEIAEIPANTIHALVEPTRKYSSRTVSMPATAAVSRLVYYSGASTLTAYSTAAYGPHQSIVAPAVNSGVLTFNSPDLRTRGSTSYYTQTYMDATTDIRYQYVIEVWRAAKSSLNLNGWGQKHQVLHIIDCAQSDTHKLT